MAGASPSPALFIVSEISIVAGAKKGLKAFVLVALLAVSLAAGAGSARAATPCWKQVLNDWFVDGRIDNTYPLKCYTQAQQHVNEDAKQYSTVQQDIQRALLSAVRRDRQKTTTSASGPTGTSGGGSGPTSGGTNPPSSPGSGGHHKGFITSLIDKIGPSNAESIPTPLLVLAGIALLLLAAAAASWFARRVHARRLRPAPAREPTPPEHP
jgi:cobalamin biosynthesis Mg chelatase CobN